MVTFRCNISGAFVNFQFKSRYDCKIGKITNLEAQFTILEHALQNDGRYVSVS